MCLYNGGGVNSSNHKKPGKAVVDKMLLLRRAEPLGYKRSMPQLLLLLSLFAAGLPRLESFLHSPSTSTAAWLLHQHHRRAINSHPVVVTLPACGSGSNCRREKPHRTAGAFPALSAATSDRTAAGEGLSQQKPKQSVVRKKTRRPRKLVMVDDDGGEVLSPPEGVGGGVSGSGGTGLTGDPFEHFVSPVEYADMDTSAATGSSSDPPSSSSSSSNSEPGATPLPEPSFQDRQRFEKIMEAVLAQDREEELPAVLTKHVDFLLSVDITSLTNDLIRQEPTMDRVNTLRNAYDFIVTFLETMVESTVDVQKENQTLLRLIIEAAKVSPDEFEKRMKKLEDRFTFEFVKYLDTEVERLEKVEKDVAEMKKNRTPTDEANYPPIEGNEVLNVIRIVRTRVCAQVDLMMGEDVAVLTRMLSFDDRFMMRAALRTVLRDKTPKEIEAFGGLVSNTLKDVVQLGSNVDPVLRTKLADMADDIAAVGRDVEERQRDKIEREKNGEA